MAAKVDEIILRRIQQLKAQELTDKVISIRLGISERTIRVYTRALRTGLKPYQTTADADANADADADATE